jgi:hypothetical protein
MENNGENNFFEPNDKLLQFSSTRATSNGANEQKDRQKQSKKEEKKRKSQGEELSVRNVKSFLPDNKGKGKTFVE